VKVQEPSRRFGGEKIGTTRAWPEQHLLCYHHPQCLNDIYSANHGKKLLRSHGCGYAEDRRVVAPQSGSYDRVGPPWDTPPSVID
jgi:hypothetical protein